MSGRTDPTPTPVPAIQNIQNRKNSWINVVFGNNPNDSNHLDADRQDSYPEIQVFSR